MKGLQGKTAIITGGATGIGRAAALRLSEEGCSIVIGDVNDAASIVAQEINDRQGDAVAVRTDVGDEQQVRAMIDEAQSRFGSVDVLFANAGIGEVCPAHDLKLEDWERVLRINLTGVYLCVKHAVGPMQSAGGGSIIINASILGHVGTQAAVAYTASKGAIVAMVKTLALDYAPAGIRVNAVSPGYIRTPMVTDGPVAEQIPELEALHPLGRLGEPKEIASCVAFLASDEASFVTGISMLADGGYTAR